MARNAPPKDPWDWAVREAALQDRVRDVYVAFQGYWLNRHINPDPCFPGSCDDLPLRAEPLHELPAEAFQTYQGKAMTTWGTVDDFKHFLPRMLELVVDPDKTPVSLDRYMVLGKLRYGEWQTWLKAERLVLESLFDALWGALLVRAVHDIEEAEYSSDHLGAWLSALAQAQDDLTSYLQRWEAEASDPVHGLVAAALLAEMVVGVSRHPDLQCGWFFAKEQTKQRQQVTDWLVSESVLLLLESAYFRWSSSQHAALLSAGHARLATWRRPYVAVEGS